MGHMGMTRVVARKEMRGIIRNRGLLFGGLWIGGTFGALNVFLSGPDVPLDNLVFSISLLVGVFVGYSFSGQVFLREKREGIVETLLCTPLSLKSLWLGKVLGAAVPAYSVSLLMTALAIAVSDVMARSILFPSAAILIHVLGVAPIFITSAISFMGLCQFLLGMRENKIIGFSVILILFPFMYPSVLGDLVLEDANAVVAWQGVSACLIVSALLFAITTYLSRYLNKERIVMTIPE